MYNENFEIFDGKSFKDLLKDIVVNAENKKNQLDKIVSEIKTLIKTASDAVIVLPLIKDCFEVGIKNDEQLIRLAAVVQRFIAAKTAISTSDESLLSEEDKMKLIKEIDKIKDNVNTDIESDFKSIDIET